MTMTMILVACLVAFVIQVEASIAPFNFTVEESACIQDLNLNETAILSLYGYGTTVEDNSNINAFLNCVWRKLGFQNEDGSINYDKIQQSFSVLAGRIADDTPTDRSSYDIFTDAVNACKSNPVEGRDYGEITTKTQNCIINNYDKFKYGSAD